MKADQCLCYRHMSHYIAHVIHCVHFLASHALRLVCSGGIIVSKKLIRLFCFRSFYKEDVTTVGNTRGNQHMRGKYSPFLHRLINRAGTSALCTAIHWELISNNMVYVSRLHALQLSSRQRFIA